MKTVGLAAVVALAPTGLLSPALGIAAESGLAPGAFDTNVVPRLFDDRRTGEVKVAVNPKDPNNIVITFMGSLETDTVEHLMAKSAAEYTSTPRFLLCGAATSLDRGRTWKLQELGIPVGATPTIKTAMPRGAGCWDDTITVDADGNFYIGSVVSSPYDYGKRAGHAKDVEIAGVWRSTDKGRTWTLYEAEADGAGIVNVVADQSTGALYVLNIFTDLLVSRDRAESFETIARPPKDPNAGLQAMLSAKRPWREQGALSASTTSSYSYVTNLSAGNGQLAIADLVDRVGGVTAGCPCAVLALSTDQGKSFKLNPVPMEIPAGTTPFARNLWDISVAVDPSRKGRVAISYVEPAMRQMIVVVTSDSGKTWSKPIRLGGNGGLVNRTAIAYGPTGALGVMWRMNYDKEKPFKPTPFKRSLDWNDAVPGPQDVFAAVAPTGDVDFSAPVQVNAQRSPAPQDWSDGQDDWSGIAVDKSAVHVVWGDRRDGDLGVWYGQIPLNAFKGHAPTLSAPPPPPKETQSKTPSAFEE
jgi:hypothetical protein